MGAGFPSTRAASRSRQAASFQISSLLKAAGDVANQNFIFQTKIAALRTGKGSSVERLKQFKLPLPFQVAQQKAESQFQATQAKAESDFLARIQSAINKQLESFKIPQVQQTPMIESESQVKQVEQSPTSLIPLAIIGAVLLG